MRILAVDHGNTFIGLAVSDPDGVVARPLPDCRHVSRNHDASFVADTAQKEGVHTILLGTPTNAVGEPTGRAFRRVRRFAVTLKFFTSIPIKYWDETDTTIRAAMLIRTQYSRRKRLLNSTHSIAAAIILQDYLDAHASETYPSKEE